MFLSDKIKLKEKIKIKNLNSTIYFILSMCLARSATKFTNQYFQFPIFELF